jgi:hypothetical protein
MEDILDVYARNYDENCILVCMDEVPRQLIGETRKPVPAGRGKIARYDTEYRRNGTCEIFMFSAPLKGWRRAEATEHRTRLDWARQVKKLITVDFPHVKKIVFVMDNLNTHTTGSLYKAFPQLFKAAAAQPCSFRYHLISVILFSKQYRLCPLAFFRAVFSLVTYPLQYPFLLFC